MKKRSLKEFLGLEEGPTQLNGESFNKLLREEISAVLAEEDSRKSARKPRPTRMSLKSVYGRLYEQDESAAAAEVQEEPVDNKVLLVLYGPPAAGKGAAKKLATDLAGKELKDGEKNFKDFFF